MSDRMNGSQPEIYVQIITLIRKAKKLPPKRGIDEKGVDDMATDMTLLVAEIMMVLRSVSITGLVDAGYGYQVRAA